MALIPTTTGPQQDHLKILSDFFGGADGETSPLDVLKNLSDNGGGGADIRAGIDARRQQEGELSDRLAADPRNLRLQMLSKQMGLEDAANPDSDLNVQASQLADKQAEQAAGRTLLPGVRAAKAQSMADAGTQAQDVARGTATGTAEGQYSVPGQAVADAASKRKIAEEIAPTQAMFGGAGGDAGGGGDIIDRMADDLRAGKIQRTDVPTHMQDAVVARAAAGGGFHSPLTNQTKQMGEAATDLLPIIDQVQGRAKELQQLGLFEPGIGTVRNFLATHGMGSLLGMGPDVAEKIGRFNTDLGLLQSGVARAHAGARGAGNSGMAERFEKLMASQGDIPTFLGSLNGVRDLLTQYASHVGGGAAPAGGDPYSDPNYQPK